MARSPFFPFYPGDWLSCPKVAQMTSDEEGAYIRTLAFMWQDADLSLRNDPASLKAISRLQGNWDESILAECFKQHPTKPGYITHGRLEEEKAKQDEYQDKKRKAAAKRWESKGDTVDMQCISGASEMQCLSKSKSKSNRLPTVTVRESTDVDSSALAEKPEKIPFGEIQKLFNEHCPSLKSSRRLSDKVESQIRARWEERSEHRSLDFWANVFRIAEASPFLRGQNDRGWKANLEFVTRRAKWDKILDGDYHGPDRPIPQKPSPDLEARAIQAWDLAWSTRNDREYPPDKILCEAVESIGGWDEVLKVTNRDFPFLRKRFIDAYVRLGGDA